MAKEALLRDLFAVDSGGVGISEVDGWKRMPLDGVTKETCDAQLTSGLGGVIYQ